MHLRPDQGLSSTNSRKKIQHYSYAISDRIGKGYSSIVYKGKNDKTNEIVAIKVIDMKGVRDSVGKEMLDCEIQALKTLKHPNILKCYDVFTTTNNCYIITQYCNQGDLSSYLQKKRKIPESQTLNLLKDIASGFIEIADKNFLHRDLKLANIFLSDGIAKIADFGFAKKNKNPTEKQKYNVGSPLYMSPQALKKNMYSFKNDIWSIGIIIYQMLHGQTPWQCKTEKELMDKMVRIPVRFSTSILISEDLKQFIKKCLEVDQSKRLGKSNFKDNTLIKRLLQKQNKPEPKKEQQKTDRTKVQPRKTFQSNKQNISSFKHIVEKNNLVIVHYVNTFRLLYKILEQVKTHKSQQKQLINLLSNQILNRVSQLAQISNNQKTHQISELKEPEKYFSEIHNPAIKKYKSVISEYFRKYNEEIKKPQLISSNTLETKIKHILKDSKSISQKQSLLHYWMAQYILIPKEIKKNYIENIIEPEKKPTQDLIKSRIKLIY